MTDLFAPLRQTTAPRSLKQDIYHRIIQPRHSIQPWIVGGIAAAALGFFITISLSPPSQSMVMDEVADTYSSIDNPWAPPSGSPMSLLY